MTAKKKTKPLVYEMADVESLKVDPDNVRSHSERNLSAIRSSLEKFGQQKPIVVTDKGRVIAGNGTLAAAKELGWEDVAVVVTSLSSLNAKQYAIADNRTGELAEWDFVGLGVQFEELIGDGVDLSDLGWDEHDVMPLLRAEWEPPGVPEDDGGGRVASGKSLSLTEEQRQVVDRAIERLRDQESDEKISEGRCVELICADWLSG